MGKPPPKNRDLRRQKSESSGVDDRSICRCGISRENGDLPESGTRNPYAVAAVCVFLFLAIVLVFGQTLRHEFVKYDDDVYVFDNPQVEQGLTARGIVWAFTTNHACNWHPLTWLSHMLDCQLYDLAPWGHHLTNVLLHAATAILLFLVLRQMTGNLWPSAFAAAVFAIHPLRAESVAWVAERKDILSGLFFMLTLWAYVRYVRRPFSTVRYLAVMGLFALGLMAKPMLVSLPFVLLLLDYWPLGRMMPAVGDKQQMSSLQKTPQNSFSILVRVVLEKVPLLVLSGASCVVTIWAQSEAIAINEQTSLTLRIGNAAVSYVAYLGKFFYPADLAVLYPFPMHGLSLWKVAGALLVLAAVSIGVFVWRRRCPYLPVGWVWYMVMLLPVIGLVQVGSQAMADRYMYLPQIGLCIALAWGVAQFTQSWPYRRWAYSIASASVLAVLMGLTWHQTSFWHDTETLWTHTLACTSQNYTAHNNLGYVLGQTGRQQEAIKHFERALAFKPDSADAHSNLGAMLLQTGRPQEAIEHFEQALRLKFKDFHIYYYMGIALMQTGQPNKAIDYFNRALQLKPDFPEGYYDLGVALDQIGRPGEAIEHYEEAVRLKLDYIEARINLGIALRKAGRPQEAIKHYQKAQELARNQGQTARAKQIEDWLNSYSTGLSTDPAPPPASK
jgi:protein O-mannosyl-transferase